MVTQQLHSWPVSRALARSAAGDSQNAPAQQLGQFGAAVQAVHCTRWVGVVLCTRAAVTLYVGIPVPTWPVLTRTDPGPPPLARRPLAAVARAYASTWCLLLNNHVPTTRASVCDTGGLYFYHGQTRYIYEIRTAAIGASRRTHAPAPPSGLIRLGAPPGTASDPSTTRTRVGLHRGRTLHIHMSSIERCFSGFAYEDERAQGFRA